MEQQDTINLSDIADAVRRRRWSLIIPAATIFALSLLIALILSPVYKSTATILIEEQEIPADFVITTVTSYLEQRLQTINQRIMSSTRLLEVIDRFNLYSEERAKSTTEEIVAKARNR